MRRLALIGACMVALLAGAPAAQAEFGLTGVKTEWLKDGSATMEAGSHPGTFTTNLELNTKPTAGAEVPDGQAKDIQVSLPPGFVGTPNPVPTCPAADFATIDFERPFSNCPPSTQLGIASIAVGFAPRLPNEATEERPIFNLVPAPGQASKFGFIAIGGAPVTIETGINPDPPSNLITNVTNIPNFILFYSSKVTLWGVPASPEHDADRYNCPGSLTGGCSIALPEVPFLTMPTSCHGPLQTTFRAASWDAPRDFTDPLAVQSTNGLEPPAPVSMTGCERLDLTPRIEAKPTTVASQSPSGLDFTIAVDDPGLTAPEGTSQSTIEKAVVTLPEGFTVNPAIADGLNVCSQAALARETPSSAFGAGCPAASKIGTIEVETPLLEGTVLKGSVFQAVPYENPFGALVALYVVIKDEKLGIKIVQPLRVDTDPATGQITTTSEDMPALPFSRFRLHFREGARSPLATPPGCGTHTASAVFYPSSGAPPLSASSSFEIVSGPGGGPCPGRGLPPFHPELRAGVLNNAAGAFSPFSVSLTRTDAEQEITNLSIKLPPGLLAKLKGVGVCTDAQIAQAASRTGPHGGAEENASPSCPAASEVGTTLAGAGVGPNPAYASGKIYLAGPYHGAPLSFIAITAGVVGPFDIGTVVVRLAIDVNPETGEVFLDSTGSDPIPHIIKGIQLHVRDIRAYADRPEFTFNPTSCKETSTSATVLGSGLDFVSPADDNPFVSTSRFQAADCAALPFKPKLRFKLKGGTKRGDNPSLRAHVAMNGFGEAAIRYAQVTLPKSEFLEQGHIGTICTRVQFNAGAVPGEQCPAASIYGKVVARTPILSEPLTGPIFLRSSEHKLPDLVAALHGSLIDISLVGRIDSGRNGGIRNTFEFVPDAPVSSADFTFFGGKKSLLSNSRNLCRSTNKVEVFLKAHSGKRVSYRTPLKPLACKKQKEKRPHNRHMRHR